MMSIHVHDCLRVTECQAGFAFVKRSMARYALLRGAKLGYSNRELCDLDIGNY